LVGANVILLGLTSFMALASFAFVLFDIFGNMAGQWTTGRTFDSVRIYFLFERQ
jgi:hypothetical protein